MTEETAKQISELYKKKSNLLKDLSKFVNKDYQIRLGEMYRPTDIWIISFSGLSELEATNSLSFNLKIKEYAESLIKQEIAEIDLELSRIQCV